MGFCGFSNDYIKSGYTSVDNVFLGGYLPAADSTDAKVYLFGLYLASCGATDADNSIEKIALSLKLSEERIISAYRYWEDQGVISISKTHPLKITYLSVKTPMTPIIKYNARDYSTFVEEMTRLFPETILTPNELSAYIEVLRTYKMDINAMLMIAKYCMNLKGVAGTPYILAVANNWAKQGITTEEQTAAHIEELEQNSTDILAIFKALNLRSAPTIEDRQLYLKWTKEYGYNMDAILTATRTCKRRGGMHKLETVMDELHNANAHTAEEVADYAKNKEKTLQLAEDIVAGIGGYYANYDVIIETYVVPWLSKGFEDNALRSIAKYCLMRNVHTLDGVNSAVDKFYKLGIITEEGLENYILHQVTVDEYIKEVLSAAGSNSFVTNKDREFYRTFAETWGFTHELIMFVAKNAFGKPFPMSDINRTLALLKSNGITTVEDASAFLASHKHAAAKTAPARSDYQKQSYTKEQLNSVFHSADEIDVDKLEV